MSGGVLVRDRAAVYNLIVQPPRRIEPAEALLKTATGYWDVSNYTSGAQVVPNRGTGGSALDAQLGSTSSVDSNDPQFLAYSASTGSYVYLPGVSGNILTVPDETALHVTGDVEVVIQQVVGGAHPWQASGTYGICGNRSASAGFSFIMFGGALYFQPVIGGSVQQVSCSPALATMAAKPWVKLVGRPNDGGGRTVTVSTSDDGTTWTQLATNTTAGSGGSISTPTLSFAVGDTAGIGAASAAQWSFRRAIVRNGIGGTTVLDVDTSVLTSGAATSFTATTGQTVTINRSSTGRKAVAVVRPVFLFGTDDYLTVADNDLLDFGATEPFTIIVLGRTWTTASVGPYVSKASAYASGAGYHVTRQGAALAYASVSDGTATPIVSAGSTTNGAASFIAVARDPVADQVQGSLNGSAYATASDTTTGALSNSSPLRIGAVGAVYLDFEWQFAAVFRRALTASEISMLATYAAARMP